MITCWTRPNDDGPRCAKIVDPIRQSPDVLRGGSIDNPIVIDNVINEKGQPDNKRPPSDDPDSGDDVTTPVRTPTTTASFYRMQHYRRSQRSVSPSENPNKSHRER